MKRGGSWNNNAKTCRSANRNNNSPGNRNNNIGFRPTSTGCFAGGFLVHGPGPRAQGLSRPPSCAGPQGRTKSEVEPAFGRKWRKLKGKAHIKLPNGNIRWVELHWYEAHGIGRKDIKIKRYLESNNE